ncbi:hypothetical protein AAMO2058_000865700 [Amorphochlora amoebiformis]
MVAFPVLPIRSPQEPVRASISRTRQRFVNLGFIALVSSAWIACGILTEGGEKAVGLAGSMRTYESKFLPRTGRLMVLRGGDNGDGGAEMEAEGPGEPKEGGESKDVQPDPTAAEKEKQIGNEAYYKRKFDEAIKHFSRAFELDPRNAVYLNNRAAAYIGQGKLEEAEIDARRALEIEKAKPMREQNDKALGRSYSRLGTIYHKKGNYSGAIWFYKNSIVEYMYPETSLEMRQSEKALKKQKEQEYIDPEKSAEAKAKGNELFRDGEYPEALKMYTEAIKRNPTDAKVWNNRAACYQKLYELRLGIKDAEKAVELDPKYLKGWSRLGQMYYGIKDLVRANIAFKKMDEIDPGNVDARKGTQMCEAAASAQMGASADPAEVQKRVQADPEAMSIMQDPTMQSVLRDLQTNPATASKYMSDPIISRKSLYVCVYMCMCM